MAEFWFINYHSVELTLSHAEIIAKLKPDLAGDKQKAPKKKKKNQIFSSNEWIRESASWFFLHSYPSCLYSFIV